MTKQWKFLQLDLKINEILLTENYYDLLRLDNSASSMKQTVLCDIIQDEIRRSLDKPLVGGLPTTSTPYTSTGVYTCTHKEQELLMIQETTDSQLSFCGCD